MTPAIPIGPAGSAITQGVRIERPLDVVEGLEPLAGRRRPDDDPAVVDGRRVKRVDRFAEFDHHVVARVDDVADRPLTGGKEPHLDVVGRRADGDALDPATDEPRAQLGSADLDPETFGRRPARLLDVGRWETER